MADDAQFNLIGLEELYGKLDEATQDMKRRGGRFALRKAAQVVRDDAKRRAEQIDDPTTDADIAANIAERWSGRRFKRTGDLMFRVGVMGGAGGNRPSAYYSKLPGGDTRHWRHVEFGTEHSQAQPFMRPAMENNVGKAIDTFVREYDKALGRALRRAKKKRRP
ncbi:MAG TPA: HK97-gp10 family putative phage morphogenesis protein [Arenicellales bacterium]|nr:HK97-gp10 family putative phage morphogenesis protein [Arenicellales bacterium]